MVNWPRPAPFRKRFDAHFGVEDVLPKGVDVVGIGHEGAQADDSNGLERPLVNSLAGFAVCCGQRHGDTSIHDALGHHRDGVACVHVHALTGDAR